MKMTRKATSPKEDPVVISQRDTSKSEDNLQRLAKSGILLNFVRENNGVWDHGKWLELCDKISTEGYAPVDFDQVGLMLELQKRTFLTDKN